MTISSTNRKAGPYAGNDSTTDFPFDFKVFAAADLLVVRADANGDETTLVLDTDYTVEMNADQDANPGGTVTLPAALATGLSLVITSDLDNLQPVQIPNNGGFYPKIINTALDRLTILVQQVAEQVGRAVKTPISSGMTPDELLESIADSDVNAAAAAASASTSASTATTRASEAAASATSAANSAVASAASAAVVVADLASAASGKGAEMVAFLQSGIGAIARDVQEKQREWVSADDYMTVEHRTQNYLAPGSAEVSYAFQAAFDALPDGGVLLCKSGSTYKITTQINVSKEVHVLAYGAKFLIAANVTAFKFVIAPEVKALTADYTAGATSISVAALASALTDGQPFKIVCDAVDPANRDSGSGASQYRVSEWAHASGGTTTSITLRNPLRFPKGINPTSSAGDEAVVDAYTTAYNARVLVPTSKTMSWQGGTFEYSAGQEATPWNAKLMIVSGYNRPQIKSAVINRGYSHGFSLSGCYMPVVDGVLVTNLANNPSNGQYGYGVADASFGTVVLNSVFTSCRHGYTSSESRMTAGNSNTETLMSVGRIVGARVVNCIGYGVTTAPFDTHHGSEDVVFDKCSVLGSDNYAFSVRGRNVRLLDCEAINTKYGIVAYTEYQSGDTDDDLYVAGKPQGCTTVEIVNFRAKVESLPFDIQQVRRCVIRGGTIESTGHQLINNDGSDVVFDGEISFTTTTFDSSRSITELTATGIFDVSPIASALSSSADWLARIIFARGAEVRVNCAAATDASNALVALKTADTTCFIENRGRARLSLSSAFSTLVSGASASYSATPESDLTWSVSGVADNSITLGLLGKNLRAFAVDESAWYDGTGIRKASEHLVYFDRPETVVAGTGGTVNAAYLPAYSPVNHIDEAGHYVRYEVHIGKAGAVGTATITSRIGTAFNFAFGMAATDATCRLVIEVFTTGDNAQDVYVRSEAAPASGVVTPASTYLQRLAETTDLAAAGDLLRFDVAASVGDTITFKAVRVYSDVAGYGVN